MWEKPVLEFEGCGACAARRGLPCALRSPRARPLQHRRSLRARAERESVGSSASGAPAGAFDEGTKGQVRQNLFNTIAPEYDRLNDLLSLGQHRIWKRMAVQWARAAPGHRALDVCTGSGDLAFLLAKAVGRQGSVDAVDFAPNILAEAAARQRALPPISRLSTPMRWIEGDAMALPFPDETFDCATIGYGLRNVSDPQKALCELRRVVRPGAWVSVLDFNNARDNPPVQSVQAFFLERLVVPAATAVGLRAEYEYLKPSIDAFPTGREQEAMARRAGFRSARHYPIMGGLMGCLVAQR
ncbi:unnamed protein product [Pedinophyceae sp. YPF-701]|nr:unnamed protein product [Pedinophyceae sp. YPF-701]